jgi:toxin FitB
MSSPHSVPHLPATEWPHAWRSRPLPVIDSLLAATAKIHRMTVTRNTPDIADLGVRILNPFELR